MPKNPFIDDEACDDDAGCEVSDIEECDYNDQDSIDDFIDDAELVVDKDKAAESEPDNDVNLDEDEKLAKRRATIKANLKAREENDQSEELLDTDSHMGHRLVDRKREKEEEQRLMKQYNRKLIDFAVQDAMDKNKLAATTKNVTTKTVTTKVVDNVSSGSMSW